MTSNFRRGKHYSLVHINILGGTRRHLFVYKPLFLLDGQVPRNQVGCGYPKGKPKPAVCWSLAFVIQY
jgi:hypothetical protein